MHPEERFRQIYAQTYRRTAAQIMAGARQTADAADLIQEVYLELYQIILRRGAAYIKSPDALMAKLAKQALARYYRSMSRRMEVYESPAEDGITAELPDLEALSVEEITEDREVLAWTERYLAGRGEDVRKIFHLYYRFGLTLTEIAQLTGRSESDVKNKLYRTLREIRAHWKGGKHETE